MTIHDGDATFTGEIIRIRADLAEGSRLAGVIAALPVLPDDSRRPLIGQYVEARVDAGHMDGVVAVPRRAIRDNRRLWVVDADDMLQVREANVRWESGQSLLIDTADLAAGDRVVVSRIAGLVPGTRVRSRLIDPSTGRVLQDGALAGSE
ncbi:MAG: hypothetical protein KDI88_08870 [Gammaproteobacteria bacterium]|nr:hypothetical protein [Gammaproteobacteria bacterium]